MAIKVIDAIGSDDKTISKIDLGIAKGSSAVKTEIKKRVGEYLVEQVLLSVGSAKTPVQGESWKKTLSKDYKDKKIKFGGNPVANMELEGNMLNSLTFKPTKEGIEIGFFNSEAAKADGHLKFSGRKNQTPQRRFLPAEGQSFRADITKEVDRIINEALLDEFDEKSLKGVETKSELYAVLLDYLGVESRAQVRDFITGNSAFFRMLQDLDLVELL